MLKNKELKLRILEISYKNKLSHLGSCLTAVDIIDEIFKIKKADEKFVLSSGHAALALYAVLEKYDTHNHYGRTQNRELNAEDIFNHHGVHPDRCSDCHIDCSSGSLGCGLPIAVGMALADRSKNVYCLISDGEMAEGSIYEALNIIRDQKIKNIIIYINWNGWSAYRKSPDYLLNWEKLPVADSNFKATNNNEFPFLRGQQGHYHVMSEEDYKLAMEILK